jgi:CheY-like chemotaxis protein
MSTILIIDDEPATLELTARILRGRGFDVFTASGGMAALPILRREPIDLVLLDLMMPHMDGIEFIRLLRSIPGCGGVPVVVVSGISDPTFGRRVCAFGADDFLLKGAYTADEFLKKITGRIGAFGCSSDTQRNHASIDLDCSLAV